MKHLGFILNYGFQDQFAVQIPIGSYTFSAECKRDDFREDEHLLVRKYSRYAEKEFVLFGSVSQSSNKAVDNQEIENEVIEFQHLKEAIMFLIEKLTVVESSFVGRVNDEIIIDPIAIYREI